MAESVRKLSVIDSAFLFGETADCPMHVGSLAILKLPDGYTGDFYEEFKRMIGSRLHIAKALRWKLASTPFDLDRPSWVEDDQFDLDRHIFRTALPTPRVPATAQRIAGWLHAKPLNRARPLWEIYVFEGLEDGRAAIYTKMHHALIDGGAGAALSEILYDVTPQPRAVPPPVESPRVAGSGRRSDVRDVASSMYAAYAQLMRAPFSNRAELANLQLPRSGGSDMASVLLDAVIHSAEWPLRMAGNMTEIWNALSATLQNAFKPESLRALELLAAPSTPLNVAISSERSYAAVSVPLDRVKTVAARSGGKVNDVVLALSSGILREYLLGLGALPKKTLTAFVPISARDAGDADSKNAVFGMVVPLATEIEDPRQRLEAIIAGATQSKELANPFRALVPHMADMPTFGTPMMLQLLTVFYGRSGLSNVMPPPLNVVVSNVFFSKRPYYCAGGEIEHMYPMSIVVHGQALNITVHGYRQNLDFGLIAGANVLADLQPLADAMPRQLAALEKAYGLVAA